MKWKSYAHEHSTWEEFDSLKDLDNDYHDFFSSLAAETKSTIEELKVAYHETMMKCIETYIAGLKLSKLGSTQKVGAKVFKEYTTQPTCTKGGQLKDYQLEGLKYDIYFLIFLMVVGWCTIGLKRDLVFLQTKWD